MATVPEYTGFVPARNQAQDVFNTNMAQYFSYIANLAPSINTVAQEINGTAVTVAQTTAEETATRTATEVEAALTVYVNDASGYATDAANSATLASNLADATAANTATYTSVSAGLAATVDTNYFRVIEAPEATRVSVYRNDAGAATLITTYYTKTGVDAKQAAAVRLNRSLQRLGDHGQTLHSDFNLAAYGLGSQLFGGVQDAMDGEELFTVQRATSKYVLQHTDDGSLKYVEVPIDTIAREWNPETGEYAAKIEGSATNVLRWSQDFTNAAWIKANVTATTTSAASPITGINYNRITENLLESEHFIEQFFSTQIDTQYAFSCFLKPSANRGAMLRSVIGFPEDGRIRVNPDGTTNITGAWDSASVTPIGDGYLVRGVRTATETRSDGLFRIQLANGASTVYLGDGESYIEAIGAQVEEGNSPTSYIPTTDAPVTRAADNVQRVLGGEFNPNEGTMIWSGYPSNDNTTGQVVFGLSDGTLNNRTLIRVQTLPSGGIVQLVSVREGVISSATPVFGFHANEKLTLGLAYWLGGWRYSINGVVVAEKTDISGQVTATIMHASNAPGSSQYNGTTEYLKYIPTELTAAQLQELTAL